MNSKNKHWNFKTNLLAISALLLLSIALLLSAVAVLLLLSVVLLAATAAVVIIGRHYCLCVCVCEMYCKWKRSRLDSCVWLEMRVACA